MLKISELNIKLDGGGIFVINFVQHVFLISIIFMILLYQNGEILTNLKS